MKDREPYQRPPIKQHRDLLIDPRYKPRTEVGKKVRLSVLDERDFKLELKEYLHGQDKYIDS